MLLRAIFAVFLLAAPASALEPMTGEEFRAFTEGHTLHVEDETGAYFGSEQYPGNDRAIWLPSEGECQYGRWAAVDSRICFVYESGDVSCWRAYRDGATSMRFQSVPVVEDTGNEAPEAPTSLILRLIKRDKRPIICPEGPGV